MIQQTKKVKNIVRIEISRSFFNLSHAFERIADRIDSTPAAVSMQWYNRWRYEDDIFTISSPISKIVIKNGKTKLKKKKK
jgi:hypothetical protein